MNRTLSWVSFARSASVGTSCLGGPALAAAAMQTKAANHAIAVAGLLAMLVFPAGFTIRLPVGLRLVGRCGCNDDLGLRLAQHVA